MAIFKVFQHGDNGGLYQQWDPMGKNMAIFKDVPIHGQSLAFARHMFPSRMLVIEAIALTGKEH